VTVTVTSAVSTVTVVRLLSSHLPISITNEPHQTETAVPTAASNAAGEDAAPSNVKEAAVTSFGSAATSSSGPVVIYSTATVVPVPVSSPAYPYNNGTGSSSGYAGKSGFISITKPTASASA
jgi:hypothetical protein